MLENFLYFTLGMFAFSFIIEPFLINFIYFTDLDLFFDLFVFDHNKKKIHDYFMEVEKK